MTPSQIEHEAATATNTPQALYALTMAVLALHEEMTLLHETLKDQASD